jgi:hypothetical protein
LSPTRRSWCPWGGVERKLAANPHTSRNGHIPSFIDKEGEVASILLDVESRE